MSLIKQTRVSLKGMTDEQKKEHKKIQMREYMNKRRKEDPEFAEKQRELCANRMKVLRQDPDYLDKEREFFFLKRSFMGTKGINAFLKNGLNFKLG